MIIDTAKYTCAGGRDINEDSLLCSEKGIFAVADGLGGHADGEKASAAAVAYLSKHLNSFGREKVSELLEGANTAVRELDCPGRTTLAAGFVSDGVFRLANAGDSRVYYFRGGRIIAQTRDHSVCQASVDMGLIRYEDIRQSEDRSRLLKVLGNDDTLNLKGSYPDIRVENGDAFIVCSDGFWEYVYENEMEADLLKSDSADRWLEHLLKRHLLRSENNGDNYTVICGIMHTGQARKKASVNPVVIGAAAALVLAAGAAGAALYFLKSDGEPIPGSTVTSSTSTTSTTTSEAAPTTNEAGTSETGETGENNENSGAKTEDVSESGSASGTKDVSQTEAAPEPENTSKTEDASDPESAAESVP